MINVVTPLTESTKETQLLMIQFLCSEEEKASEF
jgi:hypothetical protein